MICCPLILCVPNGGTNVFQKPYLTGALIMALIILSGSAPASPADDQKAVAAIDTAYQAAVKRNDADAMARILDDNFVLVTGKGTIYSKSDLLQSARNKDNIYEHQEEDEGTQTVRVWGDTAVVTALLWLKGTSGGKPFDRKLWFSDTYVRTAQGWRYAFGQASLSLPAHAIVREWRLCSLFQIEFRTHSYVRHRHDR